MEKIISQPGPGVLLLLRLSKGGLLLATGSRQTGGLLQQTRGTVRWCRGNAYFSGLFVSLS
jgi:hypothetical protein